MHVDFQHFYMKYTMLRDAGIGFLRSIDDRSSIYLPTYLSILEKAKMVSSSYTSGSMSSPNASIPVSYFPSIRPAALALGTVFEHVTSALVYGPLFGQTWEKVMNAVSLLLLLLLFDIGGRIRQKTRTDVIRTKTPSSGRPRRHSPPSRSTPLPSSPPVSRPTVSPPSSS